MEKGDRKEFFVLEIRTIMKTHREKYKKKPSF